MFREAFSGSDIYPSFACITLLSWFFPHVCMDGFIHLALYNARCVMWVTVELPPHSLTSHISLVYCHCPSKWDLPATLEIFLWAFQAWIDSGNSRGFSAMAKVLLSTFLSFCSQQWPNKSPLPALVTPKQVAKSVTGSIIFCVLLGKRDMEYWQWNSGETKEKPIRKGKKTQPQYWKKR